MGIFDALTTSVAGLQAQSFALQNISGNIANAETTGYKETDTAFADLVAAAAQGEQTADGVTASSVATNTVQGTIQSTSVSTDMAINGDGFFVVAMPTGTADNTPVFSGVNDYTRAGDFELNSDGYLVNGSGYYLMGTPIDSATGNPIGSTPEVLQFSNEFVPAQATTEIQYQANLPSTPSSGVLEPASFESSPVAGAEALGSGATLKPDAPGTGTGAVTVTDSTTLASLGITTGTITFNDGTNTTTFTVGTDGTTVGSLISFINSGASGNAAVTASLNGNGNLVLTGENDTDTITVGGSTGNAAAIGFGTGNNTFAPTNLLTQGVSGDLTVKVTGGSTQTITFGTAAGDVATMAQLQTALQNLVGVSGSVNTSNGDISLLATNPTAALTIGGTSTPFGIANGTINPGSGTVIGNDATTFTDQSIAGGSITAYDSQGNPVNIQFRWAQVSSSPSGSEWQLYYQTDSSATGSTTAWQNAGQTFSFSSSGEMNPPIANVTLQNLTVNGDNLGNVELNFGTNGLTQFADSSSSSEAQVNTLQQNGYAAGTLQSIAVNGQNEITGTFSNGQTIPLAQITLATFAGADSLQALNGNAYAATTGSGPPIYSGGGTVEGSSLESSNVDIATQFSDLIVTQQAYSANARVMQTADQMIQSLLQVIQ
jgi:flagellar hook protein FlgE